MCLNANNAVRIFQQKKDGFYEDAVKLGRSFLYMLQYPRPRGECITLSRVFPLFLFYLHGLCTMYCDTILVLQHYSQYYYATYFLNHKAQHFFYLVDQLNTQ